MKERGRWLADTEREGNGRYVGKGGWAFEKKRTRTVRDLERNESLLAIIESMAVNHRDPQENKFLERNGEEGGGSKRASRSAIDSLVAFYRTIALQEGMPLNSLFESLRYTA